QPVPPAEEAPRERVGAAHAGVRVLAGAVADRRDGLGGCARLVVLHRARLRRSAAASTSSTPSPSDAPQPQPGGAGMSALTHSPLMHVPVEHEAPSAFATTLQVPCGAWQTPLT